jgi:hypothetical protein
VLAGARTGALRRAQPRADHPNFVLTNQHLSGPQRYDCRLVDANDSTTGPDIDPQGTPDPLAALVASIEATVADFRAAQLAPWQLRVLARERREAENRIVWRPVTSEIRVRGGR